MRMNKSLLGLSVWVACLFADVASAGVVSIQQYSGFLYSGSLRSTSLEYTGINYNEDELSPAGVTASFTSNLDAENLGSVTWSFANNTGSLLADAWFFVFLDAEIDQATNTFFNESGALASVNGAGAGDIYADSWEIDEPGYLFGDIYDHLLAGYLDNSNGVPAGAEDDVSLALGFNLGDLEEGAIVTAEMIFSRLNIGGLTHADDDSAESLFFNGTAVVQGTAPVQVPEPGIFIILLTGLLFVGLARRKSRLS